MQNESHDKQFVYSNDCTVEHCELNQTESLSTQSVYITVLYCTECQLTQNESNNTVSVYSTVMYCTVFYCIVLSVEKTDSIEGSEVQQKVTCLLLEYKLYVQVRIHREFKCFIIKLYVVCRTQLDL
jgi:hypothetical protein